MTTPMTRARPPGESLVVGMLVLLMVEFLLGVALALSVSLPVASVGTVLQSSPILDLHILVAVLIVGISGRAVVLARTDGRPGARSASLLALGAAVLATLSGAVFAFGGQYPPASYLMAVGFVGVLVAAFWLRGLRPTIGSVATTVGTP